MDNAVGIDIEGHFDLRNAAGSGGDAGELEVAQSLIIGSHFTLALQYMDLNGGLAIGRGGENLSLLGGDGGIALNDLGHDAAQGLHTQGQRSNIQQQQALDIAGENTALQGSAQGHTLIGVDALEGLLAHEALDSFLDSGDTGGAAYQQHLADIGGLEARIGKGIAYRAHGGFHQIGGQLIELGAGDIVAVAGIPGISIGETVCDPACVEPLPFVHIDEPTVSMDFIVNTSPFAGREGKYVTSRNLRDRLFKEVETNVSMRVEPTSSTDAFKVSGRGELHLSILIETMRRQDFEFAVSRPKVIMKRDEQGHLLEPIEELTIDVPQEYMGTVMEKLGTRRAVLNNMINENEGSVRLIFDIPARGLMGYRSELLTDTRGNGVMSHIFKDYEPYTGEIAERTRGSLIASESGEANSYGLFNTQERGRLFVRPGDPIYEGQIVGECSRNEDIVVNVCKRKHVTNMRASGSDEALRLTPPVDLSLEQCMEFIRDDELVEVTPKNIRMRKRLLTKDQRIKEFNRKQSQTTE